MRQVGPDPSPRSQQPGASADDTALRAIDVSYAYSRRTADTPFTLQDVNVDIARGSLTGLLGPNGCGKTTLLKLLAGIIVPARGRVMLGTRDMSRLRRHEVARHIAVVPQETHPTFDFTATEMVLMGRHPHLGTFQLEGPDDLAIAHAALTSTGTAHLAERNFATLSGGEKQRVVIAGALAQASEVLLLDEPTASLDLGYQLDVASLLTALNRDHGVTTVIATHDLHLAASICDRLVLMRQGRIVAHGATRDVLTHDAVRDIYDVEADVRFDDESGHVMVVPRRRLR